MNIIVKSAVASALALGATAAFAGVALPSTNSSDLILLVNAFNGSGTSVGVYGLDTGISINTIMPGATSGTGLSATAGDNTTAFSGLNKTILASPTLSSFLSSHAGDTFGWVVEAAQFAGGASTTQVDNAIAKVPGQAIGVFTSTLQKSQGIPIQANGALQNYINGYTNDLSAGGLSSLQTTSESSSLTQTTAATEKYLFYGAPDLGTPGTAQNLYGLTGNGTLGNIESYLLGTATLSTGGNLVFSANPSGTTVPVPAAVWLFGSGVLGLVGVSRRRKQSV